MVNLEYIDMCMYVEMLGQNYGKYLYDIAGLDWPTSAATAAELLTCTIMCYGANESRNAGVMYALYTHSSVHDCMYVKIVVLVQYYVKYLYKIKTTINSR